MIKLDQGYETTEAAEGGQYNPPPPGGYIFQVIDVADKPSSSGKDMVTLSLDIAEGEFEGAFERFPKQYRQLVNGDNMPYFKAMIEAFQKSNSAQRLAGLIRGDHFDPFQLKGCLVGGCIREAEYRDKHTNEIKVGLEIAFLCAISKVPELKAPKLKKLAPQTGSRPNYAARPAGNSPAPMAEDDLPF